MKNELSHWCTGRLGSTKIQMWISHVSDRMMLRHAMSSGEQRRTSEHTARWSNLTMPRKSWKKYHTGLPPCESADDNGEPPGSGDCSAHKP